MMNNQMLKNNIILCSILFLMAFTFSDCKLLSNPSDRAEATGTIFHEYLKSGVAADIEGYLTDDFSFTCSASTTTYTSLEQMSFPGEPDTPKAGLITVIMSAVEMADDNINATIDILYSVSSCPDCEYNLNLVDEGNFLFHNWKIKSLVIQLFG